MVFPARSGLGQIRIDIGAVKDVAGAARVDHAMRRHRQRRQGAGVSSIVIPEQATRPERHTADATSALLEIVENFRRDRKSVVEGKRVDLGGRRTSKKE